MNRACFGSIGLGGAFASRTGALVISRGIQRFATGRRKGSEGEIIELLYNTKYFTSIIKRVCLPNGTIHCRASALASQ